MVKIKMTEIPFIKLFYTVSGYYLFDVNRNKFKKISKDVYLFLNETQDNNGEIETSESVESEIEMLKDDGYLKSICVDKIKHPKTDFVKYYLHNNIRHLILQVTQSCNLRCEYCIYSGEYRNRKHSNKKMSFDIAKKSLDYYIKHSRDTENLSVGFYGGEPCMNYGLIQDCVAYMDKNAEGRHVTYSMTTNATLLNEENIDFFASHNFSLLISLDGPKEIHDKHRKFAYTKAGTFDIVLKNILYMKEKYPNYCAEKVSFNMVIDIENSYSLINDFIHKNEIISDLKCISNYIDPKNTDKIFNSNPVHIEESNYEMFKFFLELLGKIPKGSSSKLFVSYNHDLRELLYDNYYQSVAVLPTESHHSGPCVPGNTRLFVTVEGIFYPCERVSESLQSAIIGNCDSGIDLVQAEKVLNYGRATVLQCRECWAFRHCDQCIAYMDSSEECMKEYCENTRHTTLEKIKDACTLEALGFEYMLINK